MILKKNICLLFLIGLTCMTAECCKPSYVYNPCDRVTCYSGKCDSTDGKCHCRKYYYGEKCEYYCNYDDVFNPMNDCNRNLNSNTKSLSMNFICGGHGVIQKNGTCQCDALYIGLTCETINPCYGQTCNSHGNCLPASGKCLCDLGYSGVNCADVVTIQPTNSSSLCKDITCNGHGTCQEASGACLCVPGYSGTNCQTQDLCFGETCSFRGTCEAVDGSCVCQNSYVGVHCEVVDICSGITCSGNGICIRSNNGKCKCDDLYVGDQCQYKNQCLGFSVLPDGFSKSKGIYLCSSNFLGPNCAEKDLCYRFGPDKSWCPNCCGGRSCVVPDVGVCNNVSGICSSLQRY